MNWMTASATGIARSVRRYTARSPMDPEVASTCDRSTRRLDWRKSMTAVIRMYEQGSPAVLRYEQATIGKPCDDQVLVRQAAIGVNYADVHYRNGSARIDRFPFVNGFEGAGTVEAVGPGVRGFHVGDRVAYHFAPGAYAEARLISAHRLVRLPDDVTFPQAAAVFAKGLTAQMLVKRVYPIAAGDVVVVHAATGGVGTLVSRWAKALGATVIATVGSASKWEAARRTGADYVIATVRQPETSSPVHRRELQRRTRNPQPVHA